MFIVSKKRAAETEVKVAAVSKRVYIAFTERTFPYGSVIKTRMFANAPKNFARVHRRFFTRNNNKKQIKVQRTVATLLYLPSVEAQNKRKLFLQKRFLKQLRLNKFIKKSMQKLQEILFFEKRLKKTELIFRLKTIFQKQVLLTAQKKPKLTSLNNKARRFMRRKAMLRQRQKAKTTRFTKTAAIGYVHPAVRILNSYERAAKHGLFQKKTNKALNRKIEVKQ